MFNQSNKKQDLFAVYVVRSIDNRIVSTYRTGIEDFVYVPISQANMDIARLGDGYYVATDNMSIAEKYKINLIKRF